MLVQALKPESAIKRLYKRIIRRLALVAVKMLFIEPGSLRENGHLESFNGKLRDELLNVEIFDSLLKAKILI